VSHIHVQFTHVQCLCLWMMCMCVCLWIHAYMHELHMHLRHITYVQIRRAFVCGLCIHTQPFFFYNYRIYMACEHWTRPRLPSFLYKYTRAHARIHTSPDLFRHVVAHFLLPALQHRDRDRIHVSLYHCGRTVRFHDVMFCVCVCVSLSLWKRAISRWHVSH